MGSPREAMPLAGMQANVDEKSIEQTLASLFPQADLQQMLAPRNEMDLFISALAATQEGRAFFEWFMDHTIRVPYRAMGKTLEETALNAARREGLNLAGELLLAAIARGEKALAARSNGATQ